VVGVFSPLDEELQLVPGSLTPHLAEHLVHLGTWMPSGRACTELQRFTGVRLSEATARRVTERAGAAYVTVQTEQAATIREELPAVPEGPPLQQVSVDGAMVPLLNGVWAEVKTLAVGTVGDPVWDGGHWQAHTQELSYFSRMTDHRTFADLALVELHRRGTERAGVVCAVVDGAEWAQSFIDLHRSDAVRILDFGHAAEYVARAGEACLGAGTTRYQSWLQPQLQALKHEDPEQVLQALRDLRAPPQRAEDEQPPTAGAVEVVEESLAYLEKRVAQIQYASFGAKGYPIGSGIVESAHNLVMESRLKGGGMHWAPEHVDPMLALRTIACSDRWEEARPQIVRQLRVEAQGCRRPLQQAEDVMPAEGSESGEQAEKEESPQESSPLVASSEERDAAAQAPRERWRPAPDHPWRHWSLKFGRGSRDRSTATAEM